MSAKESQRYIEGIGRRKTATARVRLFPSEQTTSVRVNGKALHEYFPAEAEQAQVLSVLKLDEAGIGNYEITAKVLGGGFSAQAEAIRLGIARALVKERHDRRIPLKRAGYLRRDPRAVERKKFGLRKARRSPQWSKR